MTTLSSAALAAADQQRRVATSLQTTVSSGLGSSADGKGEEGIDRSFERTRIPKYLGE